MRSGVLTFVATLASVVGSVTDPSEPTSAALEESFSLRVGESARIEAEALQIGFEDVSADSRCPKGEQCITEGDATARVWLQQASRTKETHDFHTSSRRQTAVSYLGYGVRLLRLDPYPVSGRAIERRDYVATLEVTRGSVASPDTR